MLLSIAYLLPRGVVTRALAFDCVRAVGVLALTILVIGALQPLSLWVLGPLCTCVFTALAWCSGLVAKSDIALVSHLLIKRDTRTGDPPR
jgi:hypothetical protein